MLILEVLLEAFIWKTVDEALESIESRFRFPHARMIHAHAITIIGAYFLV